MFSNCRNSNTSISGNTYLSKTTSSGQVQWIKPVDIGNVFSTAIDGANNMCVTAGSLYKYDSNGALLWTVVPEPVFNAQFSANCLGPDGTQYVAGYVNVN